MRMDKNISRIRTLLQNLDKKDCKLGTQFLEKRKFADLKDLVESNIQEVKHKLLDIRRLEISLSDRLDALMKLDDIVNQYCSKTDYYAVYPEDPYLYGDTSHYVDDYEIGDIY